MNPFMIKTLYSFFLKQKCSSFKRLYKRIIKIPILEFFKLELLCLPYSTAIACEASSFSFSANCLFLFSLLKSFEELTLKKERKFYLEKKCCKNL